MVDKFGGIDCLEPPEIKFDVIGTHANEDLNCTIKLTGVVDEPKDIKLLRCLNLSGMC